MSLLISTNTKIIGAFGELKDLMLLSVVERFNSFACSLDIPPRFDWGTYPKHHVGYCAKHRLDDYVVLRWCRYYFKSVYYAKLQVDSRYFRELVELEQSELVLSDYAYLTFLASLESYSS